MPEEELGILIRLREVRTFIAQADESAAAIEKMGAAATAAGGEMKAAAASATEMGAASERASVKTVSWSNATGGALTKVQGKLKSIGHSMTSVGLPIVAVGAVAVKMGMDFEESMTKVETLVGASEAQVKTWTQGVLELSHQTGVAPKELADALYFVTSAGLKGAAAMNVLRIAAEGAELGMGTTADIANALTTILKSYSGSGLTAAGAMDIFTATLRAGKMAPAELSSALGRVAPIANLLGISFGELGGMMASMTRITGSAATASTYMRGMLLSLLHPASLSVKALHTVGLSAGSLREEISKKGLFKSMLDLQDRLSGFSKQKRLDILGQLFPNQRALMAYLDLVGSHAKDTQHVLGSTERAAGVTAQALAEQRQKAADRMRRGLNDLRVAAVHLGIAILPMMTSLVSVLGKVVGWFDKLSPTEKKVFMAFGLGLVVLGGLAGALSKIIGLARFILVDMKLMTVAQWLWNAALDANPIGITILALVALGAIFVVLYAKFGWFRAGVAAVWNWIKGHWPLLLGILTGPIGLAVSWIITHWGTVKSTFSDAWNDIKTIFWTAWHWIDVHVIGPLKDAYNLVKDVLTLGGLFDGGSLTPAQSRAFTRSPTGQLLTRAAGGTPRGPAQPARPFRIPGTAAGGITRVAGMQWVGENGPELLSLPRGARVDPLPAPLVPGVHRLPGLGDEGFGTIVTQVFLDRKQIAEAVGSYTQDKLARR